MEHIKIRHRDGQLPRLKWRYEIVLTPKGKQVGRQKFAAALAALRHAEALVARYAESWTGLHDLQSEYNEANNTITLTADWCMPMGCATRLKRQDQDHFTTSRSK